MENENEFVASENDTENLPLEGVSDSDTQTENDEENSEVEALKQKNRELYARVKKAEGFVLKNGQWVKNEKPAPVKEEVRVEKTEIPPSLKDYRALQDVPDEDVDEVIDFAKFKGISIPEARKHPMILALLKTKQENRETAAATTVGTRVKKFGPSTEGKVLNDFANGKVPDTEEATRALAEAQFKQLLKKN